MTDYLIPDRKHPLDLTDNPEWEVALTRRAELYLAERARRADPEREPSGVGLGGVIVGALAVIAVAASAIASVL